MPTKINLDTQVADGSTNRLYTNTEKTKLSGVATGATANSSDATLLSRANHTGTQTASTISDFSTAADARITAAAGTSIATLSGGKVPSSQIPAVGLVTVQTAASQVAQLALTTQEGDVVVRTDTNVTYMRNSGTAGTMADFTLLNTPTDAVTSVNGQQGVVVLAKGDVGLGNVDNTSDATKNSATATLTNKDLTSGTNTFPTFNQNTTGTASSITGNITESQVTNLVSDLAAKQATLVSGTNIKTINGTSLLGSGDIVITGGSGSGITRSVNNISSNTAAGSTASTDYVYLTSGTTTVTLPTAVSNSNRYTVKNVGTGTVTVATTSSQTIDGGLTATLATQYQSVDLISDGTNWNVL